MVSVNLGGCTECDRALADHNTDLQFGAPDAVLAAQDQLVPDQAWMSGNGIGDSDLLVIPPVGAFVRTLLPVRVSGGATLTYGVWIDVDRTQFEHAKSIWLSADYASLTLTGTLANKLPFQHATYAGVVASVTDPQRRPIITSSSDDWTTELLSAVLPHEFVE